MLLSCGWQLSAGETTGARISFVTESENSVTLQAVLDPTLDLATRMQRERPLVDSPVPLGPRFVAGQGAWESNQTFVRVFNENGIVETQFLAYPDSISGGVHVAAGKDAQGDAFIVTAPISDRTQRQLRVFDQAGGIRATLNPPEALRPPYVIAVGRGGESAPDAVIALTSAHQQQGRPSALALYNSEGEWLESIRFDAPTTGIVQLESDRTVDVARFDLVYPGTGEWLVFNPSSGQHQFTKIESTVGLTGVYRSAFAENPYVAAVADSPISELLQLDSEYAAVSRQNIGRLENEFWITGEAFGFDASDDGEYIKFVKYGHVRADASSPAYRNYGIFASDSPEDWERGLRNARSGLGRLSRSLADTPRTLWEPCFTHRQFNDRFDAWKTPTDEATGLPKYLALSRLNNISYYGEFGATDSFVGSTYAYGLPALERLYILPLRAFLFALSEAFRADPERVISVEPNHEHEISIREDRTVGDYNPAMIRGFRDYLVNLYGGDFQALLKARNGPPEAQFDAPRDDGRGSWDAYSTGNRFFQDWVAYNRTIVNRRLADTFTQALLAGFPAELIKSHQIPDAYAIGQLDLFSERMPRITPIDYALAAGVGFGFTRYSVWFRRQNNAFKAAYTSGFDSIVMGEYQALTGNQRDANEQLIYVWENGVSAIHAMKWPASHDKGFNATMTGAIQHLLDHYDRPRSTVTGGVGQVKAFIDGERRFNIAAIGTGAGKRGLLKSLWADGTWEGSVYAVPFRTALKIESLAARTVRRPDGASAVEVGPLRKIDGGEQMILVIRGRSVAEDQVLRFNVRHAAGGFLPGYDAAVPTRLEIREYRFVLRTQLPADELILSVTLPDGFRVDSTEARRETEAIARPHLDQHTGQPHEGGVTFDWFPSKPLSAETLKNDEQ
ncbi:MAG: hypothetical protein EA353_14475 [Puniceicoccaceae bacterium]|nr:MAG: hypothetical protein EA353_14475 [Puniceicoccaceae bacterium]